VIDYHRPVLLESVLETARGATRAVDATAGHGGHAEALLATGAAVMAIDCDPSALAIARARLGDVPTYLEADYASPEALAAIADFRPDLILLDLGVSSAQLDQEDRGFTFRPGAPLDMRMSGRGPSAADWLNEADELELAVAFRDNADERKARRLAGEIARRRRKARLATSDDLVKAIRAVLGPRSGPSDFARIFQGVRIAVNEELDGLARALPAMRDALVPGGRLAVISYHSGEDRIVKHAFREWGRACICPPELPACVCRGRPLGTVDPRKPLRATAEEVADNPRARSAKLRVFRVRNEA